MIYLIAWLYVSVGAWAAHRAWQSTYDACGMGRVKHLATRVMFMVVLFVTWPAWVYAALREEED